MEKERGITSIVHRNLENLYDIKMQTENGIISIANRNLENLNEFKKIKKKTLIFQTLKKYMKHEKGLRISKSLS